MCKIGPLGLKDADFPHRYAWRWSRERGLHRDWTPYGMPRLNPTFERMVFFLYATDSDTGKRIGPHGTGVIVGLPAEGEHWYLTHFYAVSCQHVAPRGSSIVRVNTKDGGSRFLDVHPDAWQWIKGHDDLAAADITDLLDPQTDDFSALPASFLMSRQFIAENEVGIGEDGFMLGLFAELPGKKRNLIASNSAMSACWPMKIHRSRRTITDPLTFSICVRVLVSLGRPYSFFAPQRGTCARLLRGGAWKQ